MHLCLFEDNESLQFLPLTHLRPVYDLHAGLFPLRVRIERQFLPDKVTLHSREHLAAILKVTYPLHEVHDVSSDTVVFLNGRCVPDKSVVKVVRGLRSDTLVMSGKTVIAARVSGERLDRLKTRMSKELVDASWFDGLPTIEHETSCVRYPWDLIRMNADSLVTDVSMLASREKGIHRRAKVHRSAHFLSKRSVFVGADVLIDPGAVLDSRNGPVVVGKGAHIYSGAVIEGPCMIGEGTLVKIGARIYGGTSIGPMCKVGGEIDHSIMHSHANKQHDGFLGHSYISPWVNLGAGTTTSNLKNTYGTVKAYNQGKLVDTQSMFLGLIAGDHVKTGINVSLDTGTVIGVSCNLYGSGLPPKFVPSFTWGEKGNLEVYRWDRALDVARRVMNRRGIAPPDVYNELFRTIYEMTEYERTATR